MSVLRESPLPNLLYRGKVRDTHSVDEDSLLMIATDRISAFDVVLPTAIPEKGAVLNQISSFWFEKTAHIIPNHFLHLASTDSKQDLPIDVARRGMIVRNAERIDIECIVRGYITGSALSEYKVVIFWLLLSDFIEKENLSLFGNLDAKFALVILF